MEGGAYSVSVVRQQTHLTAYRSLSDLQSRADDNGASIVPIFAPSSGAGARQRRSAALSAYDYAPWRCIARPVGEWSGSVRSGAGPVCIVGGRALIPPVPARNLSRLRDSSP